MDVNTKHTDMTPEKAAEWASDFGFSHVGVMEVDNVHLYPELRAMCNKEQCPTYGTNWTCPPACGSLEENTEQIRKYKHGIIVQTTCNMKSNFDVEAMMNGGKEHMERFRAFRKELIQAYPDMLALGAGGCQICGKNCTYPDEPCRFPDEALSSMEAYGIHVNEVCKQNGLKAHYGDLTLTYVGCYMLD